MPEALTSTLIHSGPQHVAREAKRLPRAQKKSRVRPPTPWKPASVSVSCRLESRIRNAMFEFHRNSPILSSFLMHRNSLETWEPFCCQFASAQHLAARFKICKRGSYSCGSCRPPRRHRLILVAVKALQYGCRPAVKGTQGQLRAN